MFSKEAASDRCQALFHVCDAEQPGDAHALCNDPEVKLAPKLPDVHVVCDLIYLFSNLHQLHIITVDIMHVNYVVPS